MYALIERSFEDVGHIKAMLELPGKSPRQALFIKPFFVRLQASVCPSGRQIGIFDYI